MTGIVQSFFVFWFCSIEDFSGAGEILERRVSIAFGILLVMMGGWFNSV